MAPTPRPHDHARSSRRSDAAAMPAALAALAPLADQVGVELVAWPADERRRQQLARAGVPRLLVVAAGAPAPGDLGLDEDWVRVPCEPADAASRLDRLGRVLERLGAERPVVDSRNIVHYGGASVVLSASQAVVASALLEHPGRVVGRETLEALLWPGGQPGSKALDGVVFRLRRRLAGLGLVVRSAHGRGFAIDVPEARSEHPAAM